jgi:hypothetical protein
MVQGVGNNTASFVPTTNVWDVAQLYEVDVNSHEFKELLVRLYQNINNMSLLLNFKDTGLYNTFEIVNGQIFFPDPTLNSTTGSPKGGANAVLRQVFRKVINFGALPNAATKSVAHGITITPKTSFTRIYATATDPVSKFYIPIPYASPTPADCVEIFVDGTNVNIIDAINKTNFTICYVILEYLQQ